MPASAALDANATTMPNTMLNWNIPARRPRCDAGAISEMYIGATTVETPMPMPPISRAMMNVSTFHASADPTADTMYNTPIQSSVGLRPKRSAGQPPPNAPTTVPYSAAASATPCTPALRGQMPWIACSAPEITTVSKPKRNPASAEVTDQTTSRPVILTGAAPVGGVRFPG